VTLIIYASQLLFDQHFAPFFAERFDRGGDFLMHLIGNLNDCAGDCWDEVRSRPYFHRYTDDAIDLCDVLSSFTPGAKATLHELCRVMGLPGKREGIDGWSSSITKMGVSTKLPLIVRVMS
jgi:Predicted 3'-5' exonuclease related to the exonuclease domain of PolB